MVAFLLHAGSWVGHNGDHYYYASTALQYAGVPYDQAIGTATSYFHYPFRADLLDAGYQNPLFSPLIYPRVLFPLLALPTVKLFGISGIWVPGVVLGLASLCGMIGLAWRRVGPVAAAVLPVLVLGSSLATEYMFGIYSEAPLILLVMLMLVVLPLGGRRGWPHALTAAALVPLMLLSRQVPVLPVAMVLGGWLWATLGTRRWRNAWWPFVVTVIPAAVGTDLLLAVWAPYDPLLVLRRTTGENTITGMLSRLPGLFWHANWGEVGYALGHDRVGVLLFLLGMVGLVTLFRSPLAGVFLGALGSGLITVALNPSNTQFRYDSPCLPVLVMFAAVGIARLWSRVRREPWTVPPIAGDRSEPASPGADTGVRAKPAPARAWVGAGAAWSVVLVVVAVTIPMHQAAPTAHAAQVQVSRAEYGATWPLTVASGTLSCSGDDFEVWFDASDGTRYAVSGSAMARSFSTPRITSIRAGLPSLVWRQGLKLLNQGMLLCGRGYQAP